MRDSIVYRIEVTVTFYYQATQIFFHSVSFSFQILKNSAIKYFEKK